MLVRNRKPRLSKTSGLRRTGSATNPLRTDPTRTTTLRLKATRAVRRKFALLKGLLVRLVVGEDAFGLSLGSRDMSRMMTNESAFDKFFREGHNAYMRKFGLPERPPPTTNRFRFMSSPQKLEEFQRWLRQQFRAVLLAKSDEELWAEFARQGYEKGAGRAFDDVNRIKRWAPGAGDFYEGSRRQFLQSSFGRPESVDKLKLLASRTFTDLVNVTEDMAARMGRTLMDGLARGANPRELVGGLMEDLDVSEARAETIARTELIRAHAEGQLDAMEQMGVTEVGVAVEWSTAAGPGATEEQQKAMRVCPKCRPLNGVVLTVKEAHGLIPAHPRCKCAWVPANVGEDDSKQLRSKKEIEAAFDEADVDPPELDDVRPAPLIEPTKNELTSLKDIVRFWQSPTKKEKS